MVRRLFLSPLPLSPNRNGFTPSLSVTYNSGAGNSILGIGWSFDLPAIQRKTDKQLPRYRDFADRKKSGLLCFPGVDIWYLLWIRYPVFDYGEHDAGNPKPNDPGKWICRPDPFSSYRAGFEVRSYRLCQRVLMFHHFPDELGTTDCLVRSTDFTYDETPIASFIRKVTQSGYVRQGEDSWLKKSLPPLEFEYSQVVISGKIEEIDAASLKNLPIGLDGTNYQWVDLDGEGVSGILTEQGDAWFYKRNLSPLTMRREFKVTNGRKEESVVFDARFAPLETVAVQPSFKGITGGGMQFMDLAGDGRPDLVQFEGITPGFFEHIEDDVWETHRPFKSLPNINWRDPNLKFIDLTGDGHADILISEDEVFTWYPSLAEDGFGASERVRYSFDEEKGPRIVFADATQSISLADFSGDGLTDIVRIRNGEVCYWPNLGYGRFGAKVTMDNSPWFDHPDQFDQRRIRLADIDGSGVTDIIYLHGEGVRIYFNESGNRWSDARPLPVFPATDNLSAVTVTDLFGNGTACLVWSSPLPGHARRPMYYVDLMGGQKPHLMIKSKNNLGAETMRRLCPLDQVLFAGQIRRKAMDHTPAISSSRRRKSDGHGQMAADDFFFHLQLPSRLF